jgi:allantoicase
MKKASELFGRVDLELLKLQKQLEKVEKELNKNRTSVIQDGWQTQRHAKKSRKWDFLAIEKIELIKKIEEHGNK